MTELGILVLTSIGYPSFGALKPIPNITFTIFHLSFSSIFFGGDFHFRGIHPELAYPHFAFGADELYLVVNARFKRRNGKVYNRAGDVFRIGRRPSNDNFIKLVEPLPRTGTTVRQALFRSGG